MQEKKYYKPYFNEFLDYYVCGNPNCNEDINELTYREGKCRKCGCYYDWGEDQ